MSELIKDLLKERTEGAARDRRQQRAVSSFLELLRFLSLLAMALAVYTHYETIFGWFGPSVAKLIKMLSR